MQTQYAGRPIPSDTVRPSQIEEQFRFLNEELESQEKSLHELTEKLQPVLSIQEPPLNTSPVAPKAVMVPMAERLDNAVQRIRHHVSLIRSISNRLEL